MSTATENKRPVVYGVWLIVAALMGLTAAFELTLEKIKALAEPGVGAACDFSVIVQCSANINSAQGAVLGFPNPLIGLMAWPFILVTAVLVLSKVKLPKFYWAGLTMGTLAGASFAVWLIIQSVYVLGTLCPWCMVTWAAIIPTFIATLAHAGGEGIFGTKASRFFEAAKPYVLALVIVIFAVIALLAQLRLDWIATI